MTLGKSIRIYLKEGSVTGIKLAEVVNLTIQALYSPRKKIADLNSVFNTQINIPGVYFLLGRDEKTAQPKVYIGEGENVWERLKNHAVNKDFWDDVIIITSKDDNITKSHIKYLESRLIETVKEVDRYVLDNGNAPKASSLPLPDRDAMEEFLQNIKLLNGVLGHKFLEEQIHPTKKVNKDKLVGSEADTSKKSDQEIELTLNVNGTKANGIQTNEGIVVLKGSQVAPIQNNNYGYKTLRDELVKATVINKSENGKMEFVKDHLFPSPSAAAAVIVGYSINGRRTWKDKNGRSINEIEQSEVG